MQKVDLNDIELITQLIRLNKKMYKLLKSMQNKIENARLDIIVK